MTTHDEAPAPVDLDTLERLAQGAIPGPWHACGSERCAPDSCTCRQVWSESAGILVCVGMTHLDEDYTLGEGATPEAARATMRYVAAADPSTVLSLIQRIRDLEAALESVHQEKEYEGIREEDVARWSRELTERLEDRMDEDELLGFHQEQEARHTQEGEIGMDGFQRFLQGFPKE